ncbi:hypothetical protein ABBQ38_005847 [Trebouxia sp. C0009 RCD-2024]
MDDAENDTSKTCGRDGKHGRAEDTEAARATSHADTITERQKGALPIWTQMPSTQNASLEPGLRAWPPWMFASQVEKMKNPLCRAGLDLCPGRRWETLLGRQKEVEELLRWVKTNCDREDQSRIVRGPAGCGKTLATNTVLTALKLLPTTNPDFVGWHFISLDVHCTRSLPAFSKRLIQGIFGDMASSAKDLQKLDEVFCWSAVPCGSEPSGAGD